MKIIIITAEGSMSQEFETLDALLKLPVRVHVRKPKWKLAELRGWFARLPMEHRSKLSIHGSLEIAKDLKLGGFHMSSGSRPVNSWAGVKSRSFHSVKEIDQYGPGPLDYGFVSPVFDSISKPGYGSRFTTEELQGCLSSPEKPFPIFALGGVTPARVDTLREIGFDGMGFLGCIWTRSSVKERVGIVESVLEYVR